jgi:hypothetical protein
MLESLSNFCGLCHTFGENFDGVSPVQARIPSAIHFAHSAGA